MIGQIEQAIIDKIKEASATDALGYKLVKVASYGGEFTDVGSRNVIRDTPSVSVMFDGLKMVRQTNGSVSVEARYGIFAISSNLRSEKEARMGDGNKVGSYKMAEDLILLLSNSNLGLEIDDLKFEECRLILSEKADQGLSNVYGLTFKTGFVIKTLPSDEDLSSLDSFKKFHANWDIPPHGNVSTDLPADSTADATDQVELPQ